MKVRTVVLVLLVLVTGTLVAQKPIGPPTAWYALEAGVGAYHSWTPADPNFEFDLASSVLPIGVEISKTVEGNVVMRLQPGPAGVEQAVITVIKRQDVGGSWTGPKVEVREEAVIEIIRYSSTTSPFFSGQGHVILLASDPEQ